MSPPTLAVDTNVFAAILGKDPTDLVKTYSADLTGSKLVVSFQTVAELRYGAMAANWGQTRIEAMEERLERAVAIPPHDELATEWASLRMDCRQAGHPLQDKVHHADLWIAATARLVEVPLVTHDRVFQGTPGLHVICHA